MTHARHREPHRKPHEFMSRRITLGIGSVCILVWVLVGYVFDDDAEAAPSIPAVQICEPGASGPRCSDRLPIEPAIQASDSDLASRAIADYRTAAEQAVAELGRLVGAARFDTVLVARP